MATQPANADHRVHTNLDRLQALEYQARGFDFLPRRKVNSVLNGRHGSRVRGRGLNFEEIRDYRRGDDVRSIDWKVTARTRKPHVRVFTEERDRPALLVVDQRLSMFFGSVRNTKAVTAAEAAALAAWRILASGDRVGALVFDDHRKALFKPRGSRQAVNRLLRDICDRNQALRADATLTPNPGRLAQVMAEAAQVASHDHLIIVLSDFDGANVSIRRSVSRMTRHNDVVLGLVHDPSARELPEDGRLVIGDGRLQVEVDFADRRLREALGSRASERLDALLEWQASTGAAILPISSGEDTASQMHRLFGLPPRTNRRARRDPAGLT